MLNEDISLISLFLGFSCLSFGYFFFFIKNHDYLSLICSIFGVILISYSLILADHPQNELNTKPLSGIIFKDLEKEISNYNEKLISLNKLTSSHNKIKCEFKKVTYKETIAKEKLPRTLEEFNDDYLNNLKTICKKAFNQENMPATIEYNYEYSNNNTVSANFVVSIEKH